MRFMALDYEDSPMNLGNPAEMTVVELAESVIRATNSRSKIIFVPLPLDDPRQRLPDISKARAKLQWEPQVSLTEGIGKTVEYFKSIL